MPLLCFVRVYLQVRESVLRIILHGHVIYYQGILSACELFAKLAYDRVIPRIFLATLPATGAPYVTIISFIALSASIYASTGANLIVISQMCVPDPSSNAYV
jgi:hypothetical protein